MNKDAETINNLISDLANDDNSTRTKARLSIVVVGKRAIPRLVEALGDRTDLVR
jgi:hypothetical protein